MPPFDNSNGGSPQPVNGAPVQWGGPNQGPGVAAGHYAGPNAPNLNSDPWLAYLNQIQPGAATAGVPNNGANTAMTGATALLANGMNGPDTSYIGAGANQAGWDRSQIDESRNAQIGAGQALQGAGVGNANAAMHALSVGNTLAQHVGQQQTAVAGNQGTLANTAGHADFRNVQGQNSVGNMMLNAAAGHGPSAAQAQFQSSMDQNNAAQAAMAAGVHGGSAAAAMRNAQQGVAQARLQSTAQAGALRAQEQQTAMANAGNLYAQGRQGDIARTGLQGDILGQQAATLQGQRGADTASMVGAGQIAGQQRGQDIAQAQGLIDAANGIRQGDINTMGAGTANTATLGGLTNQAYGAQTQALTAGAQGALGVGNQYQQGVGMDQETLLRMAGLTSGYETANRGLGLAHAEKNKALEAQIIGSTIGSLATIPAAAAGKPG